MRALGTQIEDEALTWYLTTYPSQFVTRNYFSRSGEIDLIVEDQIGAKRELVFVEVKYRKEGSMVQAYESLSTEKKRRLWRAIQHYLARYRGSATSMRVDFLAKDGINWTHFRDIRLF